VRGTELVMNGSHGEPINVGSAEMVTINQLVTIAEEIAGVKLARRYNLSAPRGVRGRNSDNTQVKAVYGWEPTTPLRTGLEALYRWIYDQLASHRR
jgi:GDP-D-mannose 3',5'-epimerase